MPYWCALIGPRYSLISASLCKRCQLFVYISYTSYILFDILPYQIQSFSIADNHSVATLKRLFVFYLHIHRSIVIFLFSFI